MASRSPIPHRAQWPVVRLDEITTKIGSGATPTGGEASYLPSRSRFALVRSQNVHDHRFDCSGLAFISDEQAEKLRGAELRPGDLLLNITGDGVTFARACAVPATVLPACVNQHVAIVRVDTLKAEPGYVLSYLTHPQVKSYIESFNAGGSRRAITKANIESFELALPPIDEQRAIAHILGTLDDKIELNRRMNEMLEAIAQAIFKSWFVDFDPVRAKASGEPPESICRRLGLTPDLLALFPDRLVDSELGEIPEGWAAGTIAAHCLLNAESWTERTLPPVVHYVDLANTKNGVVAEVQQFSASEAPSRARRVLRAGDTIVGTVRPGNRSFALIGDCSPRLTGSTGFAVLTPRRAALRELVYFLATSEENISRLGHLADGAAYPAIRPEVVTAEACVVPSAIVIDAFHDLVSAMVDRQIANRTEATTLAAIRDSLLPKLLSGELRVPLEGAA